MKAIVYNQFGSTDVLQTVEQPKPAIQKGEVLVKIKAFSINPMDWKIRKGQMKLMSGSRFPKHTGADFAGVIEEVSVGINHLKEGDEVFGVVKNLMKEGASVEYVAVSASLVWKKPTAISFEQAASIPVVGTAALTALEKMGNITPQSSILVNGATGGFGMFLIQLLKLQHTDLTAVTGSKGIDYAKNWGADKVINYTEENVLSQQNKYDVVVDLSGKMTYKKAKEIMKSKSLFLNVTPQPIQIIASLFNNLFTSKKHIVVLSSPSVKQTEKLIKAVNDGLQIEVNKVFPFSQFKEAYQYAEKGGVIGKVVIEVN
ncbi:NAD(P)-dependent alcohol dehydrogenase [Flavobacterium rhizosphaerae]|uniref:NAD(P)-dependent alcohol dehydrogenase n=1 Tax=Flavobacterium rhizosphaerae TaxID=3163298 RepID=A0ABW8Z191_9FLAO